MFDFLRIYILRIGFDRELFGIADWQSGTQP